ncbi:hypothetical protein SESBI_03159 [Sesbania bispinosa]|nr:hypothetical protein SESBI_03159 [Sesbania bispinosa]
MAERSPATVVRRRQLDAGSVQGWHRDDTAELLGGAARLNGVATNDAVAGIRRDTSRWSMAALRW